MSFTLTVSLEAGPLSRVAADVAVVPVFRCDHPLPGPAGDADWRLCGALSELLLAGRLTGAAGEAVLLPGGGGLRARLLVALGMGDPERFERDEEARGELAAEAVLRARDLGAGSVALPFPVAGLPEVALRSRTRALLEGAAGALAGSRGELQLHLVTPRADSSRAESALRAARPRAPASVGVSIRDAEAPRRTSQLGATV